MKRFTLLACLALTFGFVPACATKDPDLEPESKLPETESTRLPWNRPVPGQGGGAFGAMPNQRLRR
jgi:hypothetical protein